MIKKREIELLAPAKNYDSGVAAINHGADAVYIAAQSFGAREAAGNPMQDIEKLARYAHRYYAKVYLVLNTILYDNELEPAKQIIEQAYSSGCDAAIIQDMGLLEMDLPPIPLFASTQTHNYNIDKIKFLESVGFQRIILARELSLNQIAEIHSQTNIDLETFVHGALCVSYSGQCYMSCSATGRSANRGVCAQFCRLPYNLVNEKGEVLQSNKHLLSLKDLNLSGYLEDLMNAGISSFKIEGRLKDISYVKNITALYRKELDKLLKNNTTYKKASSGTVELSFEPDAERSFSRGFTDYFMNGRVKSMASFDSPKSVGQYIGTVNSLRDNFFTIKSDIHLNNGDGICFIDKSGALQGTRVNRAEGDRVFPLSMKGITTGTKIYRNHDFQFDKKLDGESAVRQINADISIEITETAIIIKAIDEDGITVNLNYLQTGDLATNKDKALDTLKTQLTKTGGTLFIVNNVDIKGDNVYFYPASQINAWRRELIDLLDKQREQKYKQPSVEIKCNTIPYPDTELNYTANISNKLAEQFYRSYGVTSIEKAFEIDKSGNTLMFNRYCIKYEMDMCPSKQNGKPTGNLYLQHNKHCFKLIFDCKNCEMRIEKLD